MAKRIFELARDLGVTSKAVLTKCRAEGLDVKNHMSTVSAGLEATLREWFTEGEDNTSVEVAQHVDLTRARAQARKARRKKAEEEAPAQEEAPEAQAVEAVAEAPEALAAEAKAEGPPAAVATVEAPPVEAQAPPTDVKPQAVEAPAAPAPPAEAPVAVEPPPAVAVAEAPAAVGEPQPAEVPAAEAPKPEAPSAEEEGKKKKKKPEPIKPAGPQVVPKPAKLQGPRVVRVESPDFVDRPPRRRQPLIPTGDASPVSGGVPGKRSKQPAATDDDKAGVRKKGKRRSPRRRGTGTGRTADSGDRIREWRDRDLAERSERLAAAAGGGLRRHRAAVSRKGGGLGPAVRSGKIEVEEPLTIKAISAASGLKSAEIIRKLMEMGMMATVNQVLNVETAETVMSAFGVELAVKHAKTAEEELVDELSARPKGELVSRAPVVTFLGHVDHGKTSLLDHIRHTAVASGEAGGITQHIGAYRYDVGDRHVVFLDTPGHEAFTAMRSRGANMTDVVVLVVAADDGVMPQTAEAINHARAAGVPIVVALNKIDVPNANAQRALGQLAEHNLQPREWGGEVEVIRTSAVTGEGIDDLVEVLSLEAELLELRAEPDAPAEGYVIEAEMNPARGALARLLIRNGTLKVGDIVLAGRGHGRVRQILDDKGHALEQAGPSTPVEIAGLDAVPEAGDRFFVVSEIERAQTVAADRRQRARAEQLATAPRATLDNILSRIEAGETNEVPLIIKADVQGSVEALVGSLEKLSTDEVQVNILHAAVGGISTGDVTLADASGAIILGFSVVADSAARQLAEKSGVDIRLYRVIYEVIEDVRKALEEGLAPEVREQTLGRAEIRQVFKISRVGTVAGCYVTDGQAVRNAKVRLIRNNVVVEDERTLESLKRFKDDARDVRAGMECGIKIAGYDDLKEGDILEFYQKVEVARKL